MRGGIRNTPGLIRLPLPVLAAVCVRGSLNQIIITRAESREGEGGRQD